MRHISCKLEDLKKIVLPIGYEGENEHTRVQVDAGEVFKEYQAAVPTLKVHGPTGAIYPAEVTKDGDNVIWDIKASDCTADGSGEVQFTFTLNNVIVKSCIAKIKVHRSIVGGGTPPDPVQDWIDDAEEVLDDLAAMDNIAKTAEAGDIGKALSPKTVENGVVTEWQYVEPGAGTEDYTDLENKPQIGGVTLSGDKSLHDLGIAAESAIPDVSGKANLSVVAPAFVKETANDAGSLVTYTDGVVYVLPDGHAAGATWANTTKTATNIAEQQRALLNAYHGAENSINAINNLESNLLKDTEWKEGTVDPDTGGDAWSNSRLLSDYIEIDKYKTITITVDDGYKYMIAIINGTKTAIINTLSWSTNKTVVSLSDYSTAKYIRLVLQKTDNTLPSSSEYIHAQFATELLEELDNKVSKGEVSYDTLANDMKGIFTYKYNEEPETLNFTNTNSLLLSNGTLLSYTGNYAVTDYIDCSNWRSMKYSGKWYYDGQCLAFYDENKAFISAFPGSTSSYHDYVLEVITIPNNAKYVRIAKCITNTSVYIAVEIVPAKAGFKWIGKKWVCIGDSLTEVNTTAAKRYHDFVADNTGITVVNLGVSGTGYMNGGTGGSNPFRNRVSDIPLDTDVITIFGSFNDLGNTLGTKSDTGTSTIGGCINTTLDNIFTRLPLANVGIVTPTPWANAYPLDGETSGQAYVKLLKDICYARGLPCLDLNHCSQLRPWDSSFKAVAYSNDNTGVHPDENGHKLIAPRFEAFLDELLLV